MIESQMDRNPTRVRMLKESLVNIGATKITKKKQKYDKNQNEHCMWVVRLL